MSQSFHWLLRCPPTVLAVQCAISYVWGNFCCAHVDKVFRIFSSLPSFSSATWWRLLFWRNYFPVVWKKTTRCLELSNAVDFFCSKYNQDPYFLHNLIKERHCFWKQLKKFEKSCSKTSCRWVLLNTVSRPKKLVTDNHWGLFVGISRLQWNKQS